MWTNFHSNCFYMLIYNITIKSFNAKLTLSGLTFDTTLGVEAIIPPPPLWFALFLPGFLIYEYFYWSFI